jgi:hypothetical protein
VNADPARDGPASGRRRRSDWLAWAALVLVGAVHWVVLLDARPGRFQGPPVTLEDWPKEYRYLAVLQQAVREGRVPFFLSEPIIFSRKYLAIPETCLSPQVALLGVLPPGAFVVANTLLAYGAFCAGLFVLSRRLGLSAVPAAFLFLIAGTGGHVSAQMAVGHSMWTGFLLLPFVLLLVCRLAEDARAAAAPLWLAVVLAAILFQGALHVFTGCVLFLLLFAAFNPSRARAVLVALAWTGAAGAVRLLPAVFVARRRETAFLTGFPSLLDLARGLVTILPLDRGPQGGFFGRVDAWEYDHYVGPAGLAFLLVGGIGLAFKGGQALAGGAERRLYGPMAVMALLAYGDVGVLLGLSRLPLLSAERVTTRLLALPLLFLALIAAVRVERAWRTGGRGLRALAVVGLAATAAGLAAHTWTWRVTSLAQVLPVRKGIVDVRIVDPPATPETADRVYQALVRGSGALSLAAALALALRLRRERQRERTADAAIPS